MKITAKRVSLAGLALLLLLLFAWPRIASQLDSETVPAETGQSTERLPVTAVRLEAETLDHKIRTSGTVRANETVELRAEVSGMIRGVHFEEGTRVEEGTLLLTINDRELRAQRQRAEHQLQLEELREERQARLLERGGISQQEYDVTFNEVQVLRADLELIDARLEKTEIRAPFDGEIGLREVSPGSYVSPESLIARIYELDPVRIDFSIPERYLYSVHRGDELNFTIQGSDSTYTGRVRAIETEVDGATRAIRVRAESENPDYHLRPGSFANIELILERARGALMVPSESVVPSIENTYVFLYRNGEVERVAVTTGLRTERAVQVVEGVAPGDTVLTTGILQARSGMEVELTNLRNSTDR